MICITYSGCAESNGKKAGKTETKMNCDCDKTREKSSLKLIQSEKTELAKSNFQARSQVSEKKQEIQNQLYTINSQHQECNQRADQAYQKAREKYATNQKKKSKFDYAYSATYSNYRKKCKVAPADIGQFFNQLERHRLSIIPPMPDFARIKRELIGRTVSGYAYGNFNFSYSGFTQSWKIEERMIKEFKLESENKKKDEYSAKFKLIFQPNVNGGQYEVFIHPTYVLRYNDDWTITSFESVGLNIVKTGKYDNCVSATLQTKREPGGLFGYSRSYIEYVNKCDVELMVGIKSGGWTFIKKLSPNSIEEQNLTAAGNPYIYFVEQP